MAKTDVEKLVEYSQFVISLRKDFLRNYREEFAQLIQYSQTLMNIFGILAGFGFTAFQFIHSLILFFTGELIVIGAIVFLIHKTKKLVAGQPIGTEKWINESVEKVRTMKTALLENNATQIKRFADEFYTSITDISQEIKPLDSAQKISGDIGRALLLGVAGICLVLASFVICF